MTISTNKYKKMRGFDGKTKSAKLFRRKQLEINAELLAVLQSALRNLNIDGPTAAAAVLNVQGRAAVAKAEGTP